MSVKVRSSICSAVRFQAIATSVWVEFTLGRSDEMDVFISHASEDKEAIARPLAAKLQQMGLRVWFDESELKIGDSLSRSIDRGLAESGHGIVILSKAFLSKEWPEYELRGLTAKSLGNSRTILPIWHGISRRDLLQFSPTLADVLAEGTDQPLDSLALKLLAAIRPDLHCAVLRKIAYHQALKRAEVTSVPVSTLKQSPIRHLSLPKELETRIRVIRNVLFEVHPMTTREWMEGFQRDAHPSNEVEIWEEIAAKYLAVNERVKLTPAEKRSVFSSLLFASTGDYSGSAEQLVNFDAEKLEAIFEAVKPESDVFASDEDKPADVASPYLLGKEVFTGDEARIDTAYMMELAALLGRKGGASAESG